MKIYLYYHYNNGEFNPFQTNIDFKKGQLNSKNFWSQTDMKGMLLLIH